MIYSKNMLIKKITSCPKMCMFRTVLNFHNQLRSDVKGPEKAKLYNKKQCTIIVDSRCSPFIIQKTWIMQSHLQKALIFSM